MKIGICLPAGDGPDPVAGYARVRSWARRAEALGFDSAWVSDHLLIRLPEEPESGLLEGWTVLAALAEATERIDRLGPDPARDAALRPPRRQSRSILRGASRGP